MTRWRPDDDVIERAADALVAATVRRPFDESMDAILMSAMGEYVNDVTHRNRWSALKDEVCALAAPRISEAMRVRERTCQHEGCDKTLRPYQTRYCSRKHAGATEGGSNRIEGEALEEIFELLDSGLNQKEVAAVTGYDPATISRILKREGKATEHARRRDAA